MAKKYTVVLFSIFLFFNGCKPPLPVDTKESSFQKEIEKIERWSDLSAEYSFSNTDSALIYADSVFQLAQTIDYDKGIAKACYLKGDANKQLGKIDEALRYANEAIKLGEKLADTSLLIENYTLLGRIYDTQGTDYKKSLNAYHKALDFAIKTNHKKAMASSYNNIGLIMYRSKQLEKAIDYYNSSLEIKKEIGNQQGVVISYVNIAIALGEMNKDEEALEHYLKALKIAEEIKNPFFVAVLNNNIATKFDKEGKIDSALVYYKKANEMFIEVNDAVGISMSLCNIALIYGKQNKIDEAMNLADESLSAAINSGSSEEIMNAYKLLAETNALADNYAEAYQNQLLYNEMHDSIFTKEKDGQINELQIKYETEKKDQEIALKKQELARQKKILLFISLVAFIILALLLAVLRLFQQKKNAYLHLIKTHEQQVKCINDKLSPGKKLMLDEGVKNKLLELLEKKIIDPGIYKTQGISINECATMLETNRSYLSQTINEAFGKNFTAFINELRIIEACQLMKEKKHLTLEAIAEEVGFNNRVSFTNSFKEITGVTPSFYLKNKIKATSVNPEVLSH